MEKLHLKLTKLDQLLELLGWSLIALIWIMTFISFNNLPDIIPIHYNSSFVADGYGSKYYLLILPIISTLLFIGITILNFYPHTFNYPVKITEDNKLLQYRNITRMNRVLKVSIVIALGVIEFITIYYPKGQINIIGVWFMPLFIGLIFIPLIYFVYRSFTIKP